MNKRVLTVGLTYAGKPMSGVEIENFGLCEARARKDRSAFPLHEYDVIIINPLSYSHFMFGRASRVSEDADELHRLKKMNDMYDLDNAFHRTRREKEMELALADRAVVVWCLSAPKRMNFFGYRTTHLGYVAPDVVSLINELDLLEKKGRRLGEVDSDSPFATYFRVLAKYGWDFCLAGEAKGYTSIASTPEGYSIGGRVRAGRTTGWLVTPPTSQDAADQLIRDSVRVEAEGRKREKYNGIFMSHTAADKPFVRKLRKDLLARGVPDVWVDEGELEIGDSLTKTIGEALDKTSYVGVVLSPRSINAPWVRKELDIAMTREIEGEEVVVLPLLYEKCTLPPFLRGKLYADFTDRDAYEEMLEKLLRRLRIK